MTDEERQGAMVEVGPARLFVGLAQGTMLLALHGADEAQVWPATEHWLFVSLSCATLFVPLTVLAGLGGLRSTTLGLWTIVATAVVAGVASHSVLREIASGSESLSIPLLLCVAPALFIAYHLVAAADAERTLVASYRSYFDIGWKNGVQLALSIAFLGAFWLLLYLGAALFSLIKIDAIRQIIQNDWFSFPVSAVVFAAAVHLTDVRVGLISGARALALMLLSWLLPVMALFAIAFLLSLPFTGLEPLWATGSATFLLLTSAASLVVLINAAYQDGAQETPPPMVLRLGARLAALAIGPLVAIAGYSIWLRVEQYGLTPERVVGLAGIAVAGCYAVGYAVAALWPGRWLKPLEITNILTALVALGLIIALLTPLGDPARLAVDDQVRRLQRGVVSPEQFDFEFLRFNAARYGLDALERLKADKSSERAQLIARKAEAALSSNLRQVPAEPTPQELIAKIVVYPKGATLPESFLKQTWGSGDFVSPLVCAREATNVEPCEAFFADFDGDGQPEILLRGRFRIGVLRLAPDGRWTRLGYIDQSQCASIVDGLRAGRVRAVPATQNDLEVNGKRVRLIPPCE